LWGTNNYGLLYRAGNNKETLKAFRNANFVGDVRTRWPTSGIVAVYTGGELHGQANCNNRWHCQQKQNLLQLVRGVKELLWLKQMLGELGGKM
jgi:hypothetical protein